GALLPWLQRSKAGSKRVGRKMASCLVPEFPAVVAALERLKDLERELREDEIPFSAEGCVHLTAIAEDVAELEASRRAVREQLEVESIGNCKLRYNILNMTDRLRDDILRDKAAARASNAEEIEQLRRELSLSFQMLEEKKKKIQELLEKHKLLQAELDRVSAEHKELILSLNVLISLRYSRQDVALERERFTEEEDDLDKEIAKRMGQIKQQREEVEKIGLELENLKEKKRETKSKIKELFQETTELQGNVQSLEMSHCSCEQQLQEEILQTKELNGQIEKQKKHSKTLEENFNLTLKNLQEEISGVEEDQKKALAAQLVLKESLAYYSKVCKYQLGVEDESRADFLEVSTNMESSRLQLEERIASIVKYSKEILELENMIAELQEDKEINRRIVESKRKELLVDLKEANSKIKLLEEEIKQLNKRLMAKKSRQQDYEEKMTSGINNNRERYEALWQERAALLERHPDCEDFDLMLYQMPLLEKENRETQKLCQQEVDQIITETEEVSSMITEKQRELEERLKILNEVDRKWRDERSRNDKLRKQKDVLTRRTSELERSIQDTAEHTRELLARREEMKVKLEELQESHSNVVNKQSSALREMEVNMYDLNLMLGQIRKENSRLHLSTRQMMEDISTSRQEKNRYQQEVQELSSRSEALLKEIQEGFRQDNSLIKGIKKSDDELLSFMGSGLKELKTRNQQLMSIIALMHQVMLEFSKRLGDKAIERWQN
uniref:Myosin-9-like n=1 Tax=Xiphophorus maculatus TaxID=8083 RepID=A0A3B5PPR0_XIPMA